MIYDDELRQLFQVETEEHLQKLEQGLLHLEQHPDDKNVLDELQRELHNLKGSSRMLGVTDMENISHSMEDVLKTVMHGEILLTSELVDRLELGLDALHKLTDEALTGNSAGIAVDNVLALFAIEPTPTLATADAITTESSTEEPVIADDEIAPIVQEPSIDGNDDKETASSELTPDELIPNSSELNVDVETTTDLQLDAEIETIKLTQVQNEKPVITRDTTTIHSHATPSQHQAQVHASSEIESTSHQIETTIRVDPKKLDAIMTRAGELVVTKTHIERWLVRIEHLITTWEEMIREVKKELVSDDTSNYIDRMESALYPLRKIAFENSTNLGRITRGLEDDIRALRLLPMDRVFQLFPRTVRDLSRSLAKDVLLTIQGGDTTADKQLIEVLKDPLMHLVRNAIHHGIETPAERLQHGKSTPANLILNAHRTAAHVVVEVIDDGKGLDIEAIKKTAIERELFSQEEVAAMSEQRLQGLIFNSGFSTSKTINDISGRGVGLDVVRANVEKLKGTLTVESVANQSCKFIIKLPLTLATTRIFLVVIAERRYAIPVEFVRIVRYVALDEVFLVQDQETISWHGEAISMTWLEDLLDLPRKNKASNVANKQPCLILEINEEKLGIFVDEILEEREIVLKPAGPLLNRVRNVSGITILGSGEVCVVLNPFDLIRTAQKRARAGASSWRATTQSKTAIGDQQAIKTKKPVILLAEDSITTRTQEKRILEMAGYEVVTAVDGLAAFNILGTGTFDAIVSDIEMPNMDGLTLTSKVRENKMYENLPIVLVSSLASEEDRKRGMDVGADAYIAKSAFNQQILIDTLGRLV